MQSFFIRVSHQERRLILCNVKVRVQLRYHLFFHRRCLSLIRHNLHLDWDCTVFDFLSLQYLLSISIADIQTISMFFHIGLVCLQFVSKELGGSFPFQIHLRECSCKSLIQLRNDVLRELFLGYVSGDEGCQLFQFMRVYLLKHRLGLLNLSFNLFLPHAELVLQHLKINETLHR